MDLGSSLCSLGGVGKAHHFHTRNVDPDQSRCVIDDPFSTHISGPNFHSGANGDFQEVAIVAELTSRVVYRQLDGHRFQAASFC